MRMNGDCLKDSTTLTHQKRENKADHGSTGWR